MSIIGTIQRQLFIIRFVKKHPFCSLKEIYSHVEDQFIFHGIKKVGLSEKTLHRDFKSISDLGLSIDYSKNKGYFIPEDESQESYLEEDLESFYILNSIGGDDGKPDFIFPEERRSRGSENFLSLKKAIQENRLVQFEYKKFESEKLEIKTVEPYALKASRGIWYLLGFDKKDPSNSRSYGLDRMCKLELLDRTFKKNTEINWNKLYEHSFAMFTDGTLEEVILSYDIRDGNYIEAMPIHTSQKIMRKGDRVFVTLNIMVTLDLIMELMSRSWSLEVIAPLSLRQKLHKIYKEAMERNG